MNYYDILGVDRKATPEEIKKAYRVLAFQLHPDRNFGDKECEEQFKEVAAAYEVLSISHTRAEYDMKGYVGRRRPDNPSKAKKPSKPAKPKEPPKTEEVRWIWDEDNILRHPTTSQLESVVSHPFSNGLTGNHIIAQVFCTAEELKLGCVKEFIFKKREMCRRCVGDGDVLLPCNMCKNKEVGYCPECDNQHSFHQKCPDCSGAGVKNWVLVKSIIGIPQKTEDGSTIIVYGEGENAPNKAPGNIRVVVLKKEFA